MTSPARTLLAATLLLSSMLLTPAAPAQTGAWTDGEFLVLASVAGQTSIVRVVPETGASAVLVVPQAIAGGISVLAFDPFRGGLLANASFAPDNPSLHRLWLIAHDGSHVALPGLTGALRALCSAGDGRIFFMHNTGLGPKVIEYLDASDQLRTLKAADGVTPFTIEVEHLLYHAPTNALIGSSTSYLSTTDCSSAGSSLYRIPLSADGLKVDGTVSCAPSSSAVNTEDIMSLDHLPDGRVLVTLATGSPFSGDRLIALDPATMAVSGWAHPSQADINGGAWSARLHRAAVHAITNSTSELRTFAAGVSGLGALLPTSIALLGGSGYSPAQLFFRLDANGPACHGLLIRYGEGLAGKGGLAPQLDASGCPDIGHVFTLSISAGLGGAGGVLLVGLAPGSAPFKGGTLLVGSLMAQIPLTLPGAPGVAGAGALSLPAVLASPVLAGVDIHLQAAFADAAAVHGVSLSNGLRLQGD